MSACILPLEAARPEKSQPQQAQSQKTRWVPSDRDRVIFQWVKFDGHTQSWVAQQLEISQSTVSRIVERYERWIARGGPAASGGLSHEEELRYHRWLTIERNERIIASCLRIANDLEQTIDVSRTTITRNNLSPSQENEIKTYHETLDRTAAAARFYRLAYRINMEQLKLRERPPLPDLEPLTEDEAENFLQSDETTASVQASGRRQPPGNVAPLTTSRSESPVVAGSPDSATSPDRQVSKDEPTHNVHNHAPPEPNATSQTPTTSEQNQQRKKSGTPAYAAWLTSPEGGPIGLGSAEPSPPLLTPTS